MRVNKQYNIHPASTKDSSKQHRDNRLLVEGVEPQAVANGNSVSLINNNSSSSNYQSTINWMRKWQKQIAPIKCWKFFSLIQGTTDTSMCAHGWLCDTIVQVQ